MRSLTQNWTHPAHYLKCDLANFFVSIDKHVLWAELERRIPEPFWRDLAHTVLFHDPRADYELRCPKPLLERVPPHKRLVNAPADTGLPIGNLSSQFFANVLLNVLDQHVKHQLRIRHYGRYVDDFYLLHEDPAHLNACRVGLEAWLPARLHLHLNPRKTVLQPVDRGIDFVGQVVRPWHRATRPRTESLAASDPGKRQQGNQAARRRARFLSRRYQNDRDCACWQLARCQHGRQRRLCRLSGVPPRLPCWPPAFARASRTETAD